MTDSWWERPSREHAQYMRRAAALWRHYHGTATGDSEGILAVLDDAGIDVTDEAVLHTVAALLNLGGFMVEAARVGAEQRYLDEVMTAASLHELAYDIDDGGEAD